MWFVKIQKEKIMAKHSSRRISKKGMDGLTRIRDAGTGKWVWSFRGQQFNILRDVDAVLHPMKYASFKFTPVDQIKKSDDGP